MMKDIKQLAVAFGLLKDDDRGTSMITTAITLPLFLVLLIGIWWLGLFMYVKWTMRQATNDAAQFISENARYWNINPDAPGPGDLLPADYYDYQAKRIVWSRLSDILPYDDLTITNTLGVTVTEPALALGLVEDQPVCDSHDDLPGDQRKWEDAGFLVYTDFTVPFWLVKIPWSTDEGKWGMRIRLRDRAVGHIQCPRWTGKGNEDRSKDIGSEGPSLPFRRPVTAVPVPPTVTELPPPASTITPTVSP